MSYRFDLGLVPGPVSHMRVACSSCDYPDDDSGGITGDEQGLPALRPNVAIIIIGLGFTLVVVAAFAVFAKFMRPHMNRQNASGTSRLWEDVGKQRPVDAKFVDKLPRVVYSAESFQGLNLDLECAVCLCRFEEGEELRLLPNCKHMFHPSCIDGWLLSHPFCPLCRSSVLSSASWAVRSQSERTAQSPPLEAPMPREQLQQRGGNEARNQQQSPGLDPHVDIPMLECFEARFEVQRGKSSGRKGTRCSSGAADSVEQDSHIGSSEFERCEPVSSTISGQRSSKAHRLGERKNCDLPVTAVCISILPEERDPDPGSTNATKKRGWPAVRSCSDRILEEGSTSTGSTSSTPSSPETTAQLHR